MKNLYFSSLILCLSFSTTFCQDVDWFKQLGGQNMDFIFGLETDPWNNVITAGQFIDGLDFDPGPGTYNLTANYRDAYISKLDEDGNFVWAFRFGGNSFEGINDIEVDVQGNIYAIGTFGGTTDFDPGPGSSILSPSGVPETFIAKYDKDGIFVWVKRFRAFSGSYVTGVSIELDAQGNIYLGGEFEGTIDFNPGAAANNLTSSTFTTDGFICKLDNLGAYVWAKKIGGSDWDGIEKLQVDPSGNVYAKGYFTTAADLDPGPNNFTLSSAIGYAPFLMKLNTAGNFEWAQINYATDFSIDATSNVFLTGTFNSSFDADPDTGTTSILSPIANYDSYLTKLSPAGSFLWAQHLATPNSVRAKKIVVDRFNNIHLTGIFNDTVDFDQGTPVQQRISQGGYDIFAAHYNTSGNFIEVRQFGYTNSEDYDLMNVSKTGHVHIGGTFFNTIHADSSRSLTTIGTSHDVYLAKFINTCSPTSATINAAACSQYTAPSGLYTWSASGFYQDTISNAYGCDSVLSINLTIIGSTSNSLSVVNCGPYIYHGQSYDSTGIYQQTLANSNAQGCDSIVTLNLDIRYLDPIISTVGDSLVVNTPGMTYQWYDCLTNVPITGATGQSFSPTYNSSYGVQVTDSVCDTISNCLFFAVSTINKTNSLQSLARLFPNPNQGHFQLDFPMPYLSANIKIFNAVGQLVHERQIEQQKQVNIHLEEPSGIYFLHLNTDQDQEQRFKIIKISN